MQFVSPGTQLELFPREEEKFPAVRVPRLLSRRLELMAAEALLLQPSPCALDIEGELPLLQRSEGSSIDYERVFLSLSDKEWPEGRLVQDAIDFLFVLRPLPFPEVLVLEPKAAGSGSLSYGPPSHHRWPTVKSHHPRPRHRR